MGEGLACECEECVRPRRQRERVADRSKPRQELRELAHMIPHRKARCAQIKKNEVLNVLAGECDRTLYYPLAD
eukprot:scaffold6391_cov114-Isochrysis_galbana.AAC.3